jgi:hypothetical protein
VAEALLQLGRLAEALAAIDEGLAMVRTTLAPWQAPELWRVHGELLAATGSRWDAVEASFERGREMARAQGGRAFELRATTALAYHLRGRGRETEARTMLVQACTPFTEGLDTTDVRTARALLRALGG